jgi:histidyl-tRNA synthetase
MTDKSLSTDSYKGVRDFYPEDMAVQRYIFDTWAKTAESFGFERYDASILEPAELYKAKGAENEEMVNEQTYTFTDRGDRQVTLRPEMTPTVARMIAGKRRELSFPVRWYSIPNLFRYERPQRGRLREHWQLNCDLFGASDLSADVEIIALAHQLLLDFDAKPEMFEIRINNRQEMKQLLQEFDLNEDVTFRGVMRAVDRFAKISEEEKIKLLSEIEEVKKKNAVEKVVSLIESQEQGADNKVLQGLYSLGIHNVRIDRTLARGFDYYTGTIFEIFDVSGENNRSMLGGGRYDNLTGMFGGDPITGIGFGMGDVTMRDFLETHKLLPESLSTTGPEVMVIPMEAEFNLAGQALASTLRRATTARVATDIGTKKLSKKIGDASDRQVRFVIVIGENEVTSQTFTIKDLRSGEETTGALAIIENIVNNR